MTQKEKAQNLVWIKLEMVTDDRYAESYEDVRSNEAKHGTIKERGCFGTCRRNNTSP